jgi:phosphate transport system substrate-binding protein
VDEKQVLLMMGRSRIPGARGFLWLALVLGMAILLAAGCRGKEGSGGAGAGATQGAVSIQNTGSDTLVNLALAWAEAYMSLHPEVRIAVTGGGSGTGIAGLLNGTVQIANASRQMSPEELERARAKGFEPVRYTVAQDAIAVVVNPANPVNRLSLARVSELYTGKITRWKALGGQDRPVVLLSRESNSGTYVYFLEHVVRLGKKEDKSLFSPETLLMPSSEGISTEVRQNPNAIGYDGLGYVTGDQKTLAVAREEGGPYVLPSADTVNNGAYPIARPLFVYVAGQPSGAIKEYLEWVTGEGQALVKGLGFVPLR